MMVQKKVKEKSEKQMMGSIMESARLIWLAGLGAFAKAEREGSKLFESLVKEGEDIEERTKKIAEETVEGVRGRMEEVRTKASDTWESLEQVFEERVARVLNRLGVPTNDDVQELAKRVEELHESVRALTKEKSLSKE
jgi:poly(hydroxyalkanoate) granule-associated protein